MKVNSFFLNQWKVEPELYHLSNIKEDNSIKLEPQLMIVLMCLVQRKGQLVTKEELMKEAWSDVIVSDNVLTRAISSLRKVLGDNPQAPTYIETISKTGYRLIAKVEYPGNNTNIDDSVTIRIKRKPIIIAVAIISLLLFSTWKALSPKPDDRVFNPNALANSDATEYYPSISNDGQFVAYASNSNKNWDVYIKRIGTENTIRLTKNAATEMRAVWSSDDAYVYYIRYEASGTNIYKTPMTGGKETRVFTANRLCSGNFDISPDNKEIAFNSRAKRGLPLQIEITHLEQGTKKLITNPSEEFNGDIHPTYSPDGNKIGFIREKNSTSMYLYIIDLISGKEKQITQEHLSINGFDWSADGKSLIYSTDKTGVYKIWQVFLDDLKNNMLPISDYQMVMPRIAKNDEMIYAKIRDNVNIWSYVLNKQEAKSWRSTADLNLNPSFSPDGSKVVFTTNKSGSFQIWISNADGSEAIAIASFKGEYINSPRWSPDGTHIVFQGHQNGQTNIYKVNALGGIPVNLTKSEKDDHTPIFSVDGKFIYYSSNSSGNWEIWRMTNDGKSKKQITTEGGYAPQLLENNNNIDLFYIKKDQLGIWKQNLKSDKSVEVVIVSNFTPKQYGAYSIANNGIYYFNPTTRTIDFLDFTTDTNTSLIQPKRISPFGISLSYSKVNETLLYAQIDEIDADIMLAQLQK